MTPRRNQWELFLARHRPIRNHIEPDAPYDRLMFETYGAELDFVRTHDCHRVFTLVEGDSGRMYVATGFHLVNRIGYFVAGVPWTAATEHKVYKAS